MRKARVEWDDAFQIRNLRMRQRYVQRLEVRQHGLNLATTDNWEAVRYFLHHIRDSDRVYAFGPDLLCDFLERACHIFLFFGALPLGLEQRTTQVSGLLALLLFRVSADVSVRQYTERRERQACGRGEL